MTPGGIVKSAIFFILLTQCARSQLYVVPLDTLSTLDDPDLSIEIMRPEPARPVTLPPVERGEPRFIREFYSWRMTNDPDIVIMVARRPDGDLLYIDRNLNGDLTDDGPPLLFSINRDSVTFEIVAPSDSLQRVRLLLARTLTYRRDGGGAPGPGGSPYLDASGNLNKRFARFVGNLKGVPDFQGDAGSFYFEDRVTVRRGTLMINGSARRIGLFDYSNNGLFDDDDDVLLVDTRGNGALQYSSPGGAHTLTDVFSLGGVHLKVHDVDRYGRWVRLEQTSEPLTSHFVDARDSAVAASGEKVRINPELWHLKGTTLDGDTVDLGAYRGEYLLLNFWGDWCKPCLEEIPALVRAAATYPSSKFRIISFVKVGDLAKVRSLIADFGITWPQLTLDHVMEDFFDVNRYPTNILIFPDAEFCLHLAAVNDAFFSRHIR